MNHVVLPLMYVQHYRVRQMRLVVNITWSETRTCSAGHLLNFLGFSLWKCEIDLLNTYALTTKYQDTKINCHFITVKSRGMSGEDRHYETPLSPCPKAHPLNLSLKRWENSTMTSIVNTLERILKSYVICLQHSQRELTLYVKHLLSISCKMCF